MAALLQAGTASRNSLSNISQRNNETSPSSPSAAGAATQSNTSSASTSATAASTISSRFLDSALSQALSQVQTQPQAAAPAPDVNMAERYANELVLMQEMGLQDEQINVQALLVSNGNVEAAINLVLGGFGSN